MALLSPASLTLKFDAILGCEDGDEALSDSALPLLFRPLSPRVISTLSPPGLPRTYTIYEPAVVVPAPAIVEEIIISSPSSTLVGSPATTGHGVLIDSPRSYATSSGSTRTRSASGHRPHGSGSSSQYVYAQPARSVRSSGSVATARERDRPRYERAKSSGVKMTVIPATPRRVSRGSVVSYKSERDKEGKLKFSTKLRRLFGLGPKREETKASERAHTTQYVYPSGSSGHRRSTSRGSARASTTRVYA